MANEPSLKNVTNPQFGKPSASQNKLLQQLGAPHVNSFNYMVDEGLDRAIADLNPVEFLLNGERISLKITDATLYYPMIPKGAIGTREGKIYPTECRQRAASYKGKLIVRVDWSVNDVPKSPFEKDMGEIPIMIKSNRCHLASLKPKDLVAHGEHEQEWGGYFVVKGHERLIRMLTMTRRNYPTSVKRSSWKGRGNLFSDKGILIRCVSDDQTGTNNVLHFVTDGSVKLMFSYKKMLYYTPLILILKCLCDVPDFYIYKKATSGFEDDSYYKE